MAALAGLLWPANWPELLPTLVRMLEFPDSVAGGLLCISHMVREIVVENLGAFMATLSPPLFALYEMQRNSPTVTVSTTDILCRTLRVIKEVVVCLGQGSFGEDEKTSIQTLQELLRVWFPSIQAILSAPLNSHAVCAQKIVAVQIISNLTMYFPTLASGSMNLIIPPMWESLTFGVQMHNVLVQQGSVPFPDAEVADDEGYVLGFEAFAMEVFEFYTGMSAHSRLRKLLKNNLSALIQYLIPYLRMTCEQEEEWIDDASAFVNGDDEDTLVGSVRASAYELLEELNDNMPNALTPLLIQHALAYRLQAPSWREKEACWLALSVIAGDIQQWHEEGNTRKLSALPWQVDSLIQMLREDMAASENESPFLAGRALWCIASFFFLVPDDALVYLVQTAVAALQPTQPVPVRVSACRTLAKLAKRLPLPVLHQYAPLIEQLLLDIIQVASVDIVSFLVDTLQYVVAADPQFHSPSLPAVIGAFFDLFARYPEEFEMSAAIRDTFATLAKNGNESFDMLAELAIPRIVQIFGNLAAVDSGSIDFYLSTASYVVAGHHRRPRPAVVAPLLSLVEIVLSFLETTDDASLYEPGCFLLRLYLYVLPNEMVPYIDRIYAFALRLIDASFSDQTSIPAAPLMTTLLRKHGQVLGGERIRQLSISLMARLSVTKSLSLTRAILLVYIQFLCVYDVQTLFSLLQNTPTADGNNALTQVLEQWSLSMSDIFGQFAKKCNIMAITKVLSFNDPNFAQLRVPTHITFSDNGAQVFAESAAGMITRSKAKSAGVLEQRHEQLFWTRSLSVLLDQYKQAVKKEKERNPHFSLGGSGIVVGMDGSGLNSGDGNLQQAKNAGGGVGDFNDEDEDEDEDDEDEDGEDEDGEDDEDDEDGFGDIDLEEELYFLMGGYDEGGEDLNVDVEELEDPLSQLEVKGYIEQFLRAFNQQDSNRLGAIASQMKMKQQQMLQQILNPEGA